MKNWPIKKLGKVEKLIQPIIAKYERLGITTSTIYSQLRLYIKDQKWIEGVQDILDRVENAQSVFSIVSEITIQKNDQKVLEMFSEIDAAKWLIKGAIDGEYNKITYIKKDNTSKSPDFVAYRDGNVFPVEVKMLSPQNIGEDKFTSKFIEKVNDEAIPQLVEFGKNNKVESGLILIWTHHPIKLERITYNDLNKSVKSKVIKPSFPVAIFVTIYMKGIWDFYL